MLQRVRTYIDEHHLFCLSDKILVALSGGADSVALLHILTKLGYSCEAAHCNFHLRGDESNRDQTFVESLTKKLRIPLHIRQFDTKSYAKNNGISIEMAARELRYDWFEELRRQTECSVIAVAHHQDDQAETILLNLYRSTGLRGMRGMLPKNGYIVRPLLCTNHNQILYYLKANHIEHVEDSTNSDTTIARNAIRAQLRSLPPQQIAHIAQTAEYMRQYTQIVEEYINDKKLSITEGNTIDINALLSSVAPKAILYEILREYGFSEIDDIYRSLTSQAGKIFYSSTHQILKDRDQLIISEIEETESKTPQIKYQQINDMAGIVFPKATEWTAILDGKVLQNPLTLRHWEAGDTFIPIGMRGKKKLQDFFTDMHIPLTQKNKIWLLCSGKEIVWVVGYRLDNRYKITPDSKQAVKIEIIP